MKSGTTEPDLQTMVERYLINRKQERKYREIADRYEKEIMKILSSQFIEDPEKGEENE